MRTFFFAAAIALNAAGIGPVSLAQTADPNIAAKHAIGEIKTIDAAAKQLTIKTDAGSMVTISLSDKTTYKKLAPGEQSLTNATDLTFADLGEGDRVMARGTSPKIASRCLLSRLS
jgi:Cu/Ag efflux protein CusF